MNLRKSLQEELGILDEVVHDLRHRSVTMRSADMLFGATGEGSQEQICNISWHLCAGKIFPGSSWSSSGLKFGQFLYPARMCLLHLT